MKYGPLELLVVGVLTYYLIKGIMFLGMWVGLGRMTEIGKERAAKQAEERRIKREKRDQRARENAKPKY